MATRFSVCIGLIVAFAAHGATYAHPAQHEPAILAEWLHLGERDAMVALTKPQLALALANPTGATVGIVARLRVASDGQVRALPLPPMRLGPEERRTLPVTLPPGLIGHPDQRFAGKITLALEIDGLPGKALGRPGSPPGKALGRPGSPSRKALGHLHHQPGQAHAATPAQTRRPEPAASSRPIEVALPTLYFHPTPDGLLVYREDVLRETFAGGNFRGIPLVAPDPLDGITADPGIKDDLARSGLAPIEPVLAFVYAATTRPGPEVSDLLPPGSRKFCYGVDGAAFDDSSSPPGIQVAPPSEDFGLEGDFVPAARGWVAVGQLGAPLFTGFLDRDGCTPYVITNPTDDISTAFFPLYRRESNLVRGFVSDLNLGAQWPDSMPYFLFFFPPGNSLVRHVMLDEEEYVNTVYVAAANAMERVPGGLTDVLYEFRLREAGDNAGTSATYAAEGHPLVQIKYSAAARQKFTIGHEYAHAMHIATLSPPLTPNDLDYSVTDDEPEQNHTLTSKEWQLTAAFEGFAHFIAGIVWNEAVADEGAVFRAGSIRLELDELDRLFETNFQPGEFPSQGVESDWAQFFWNYLTDTFTAANGETVIAPTVEAIFDMWLASHPWPVTAGFFIHFREEGVEVILETFGPQNPVATGLERFDAIAAAAGVDH